MTFFFCLFKGPQYSDKEPSQAFHRHPFIGILVMPVHPRAASTRNSAPVFWTLGSDRPGRPGHLEFIEICGF